MGGALKALREPWLRTPVQRCPIHVSRDTVRDPTLHPRTAQGRALLGLSRKLLTITTTDRAAQWLAALNDYANEYRTWLNQRTAAEQDPATAARTGRTWWYNPRPHPPRSQAPGAHGRAGSAVRPPDRPRGRALPHTSEEGLWTRKGWAGRTR